MSKRISALSIAVLVLAGTFVNVSGASAATAYKTCKPAKAKATIGKLSYTCAKNPASTSTKLVWVSKKCLDANAAYVDYLSQISGIIASYESTVKRAETVNGQLPKRELAWNNQVRVNQAALDKFLAKNPNVLTSGTQAEKDSVTHAQASIAKLKENIANVPSIKASNDETIAKAKAGLDATNAENISLKASVTSSCK